MTMPAAADGPAGPRGMVVTHHPSTSPTARSMTGCGDAYNGTRLALKIATKADLVERSGKQISLALKAVLVLELRKLPRSCDPFGQGIDPKRHCEQDQAVNEGTRLAGALHCRDERPIHLQLVDG